MTDKVMYDVIIIGAGPAGLTCGLTLAREKTSVLVLEEDENYVGGISRTVNYKGYLFDIGGHRFFSKSKEVNKIWHELLPNDFLERPRLSRIFYRGKYYAYPLDAVEALRNLGIGESILCLLSFLYAKLVPIRNPKSFHQWVRNAFGERLFQIFFKTYTEKVWGMSCDDISADWAAQRIKGLNLWEAFVDGLKRSLGVKGRAKQSGVKTLINSFLYPRKGPGMMWDAAANAIRKDGGKIAMGRKVTAIDYSQDEKTWTIRCQTAQGNAEKYCARNLVSSMPIRDLFFALSPKYDVGQEAKSLRYRDFLTVVLIGKTERHLPDNWIYIHDPSVYVGRVQNYRSWSPEMIPNQDTICLGLEYFCSEGDDLWDMHDDDLIALAKREISQIGIIGQDEIIDGTIIRQRKAYPVYDDQYKVKVENLRELISRTYPSLHLIGRNGMHKYNNQDHAMMTGLLTALNIIRGQQDYDVWHVNEDAEYGESGLADTHSALANERLVPLRIVK